MSIIDKFVHKSLDGYFEKKLALTKQSKKPPITEVETEETKVSWFGVEQSLYRRELNDWQTARLHRYDRYNTLTYPLQQLYRDAMLDLRLNDAVDKRIRNVTNKTFWLKDKSGNIDINRSVWLQTKWFRKIVKKNMESKFYGYSMLFVTGFEPGKRLYTKSIEREHIIPEKGLIVKNPLYPTEAIRFSDFPTFFLYFSLGDDSIGLLEKIAPLTILKRHSWASWDDLEQIFGIPIRIARTMIDTEKHKNELAMWLENMGSRSYGIFDKRVDIEIKENHSTDVYNIFNEKRKAVNEEITIAVNGQTMTTMDGSSRAQGEVHERTQDEITNEDIEDIKAWFDDEFANTLRAYGFDIPEGYYLDILANTTFSIEARRQNDDMLQRNGWNLTPEYVKNTYDVELDEEEPRRAIQPNNNTELGFFI